MGVPLQMIEFYLILAAVNSSISAMMFWRLLIGTVVMLAAGYCGEAGFVNNWAGFTVGMLGWGFILYEIFLGEAGSTNAKMDEYVKASFATMRFIVTIGWSIYPLGYFFGYLMGQVEDSSLNFGLQPCRLGEQDCVLPCNLEFRQAKHSCWQGRRLAPKVRGE